MAKTKRVEVREVLPPAPPPARRWKVELQGLAPLVVEAADEAGAWDAYKAEMGVTASDWAPRVTEVTDVNPL